MRALAFFNTLMDQRVRLSLYHYTLILVAAAREDRLGRALQIKHLMTKRNMVIPQRYAPLLLSFALFVCVAVTFVFVYFKVHR